jgi:hypothetical protein
MSDDFIESLAQANLDSFFSDLRSGAAQESAKNLEDFRKAEDVEQFFGRFEEELQLAASGRSAPSPRLRSEHQEFEVEWKPGDPVEDGPLEKRYSGRTRIEKSESGWTQEFSEDGRLIRAYGPQVDPALFK